MFIFISYKHKIRNMAFYVRLKKFFQKHDPDRLYMVKKIVRNFAAQEDDVMARLEEIYSSGGPSKLISTAKKGNSFSDNFSNSSNLNSDSESSDVENSIIEELENDSSTKKSKKKLILILVVSVIVIVGGYFGYSMFMGSDNSQDSHAEESTHQEHNDETHDTHQEHQEPVSSTEEAESEILEQPTLLDTLESNDSTILNSDTLSSSETEEIIESVEAIATPSPSLNGIGR